MLLDILPLPGGGARLVRVWGQQPCLTLPAAVPAPDGGAWALTELGDYCFSQTPRALPAPEALCRYAAAESGGAPQLVRAFGREPAPAPEPDDHAVCGNFLEELTLPDSLRVLGGCAFYNCRALRRLSVGAGPLTVGSDVFLNCFALQTLVVRAEPQEQTGLFALVNNISEAVRALLWPAGAAEPRAGLWYPAYWEDYEETPAHILVHTYSGQGYHYRQCFGGGVLRCAEYDAIFPQSHDADDAAVMALLCFDRLRWPWQLGEEGRAAYRAFLAAHTGSVVQWLLAAQDTDGVRALLALDVLGEAGFAEAVALAARAEAAEAAALFADAQHARRAAAPKTPRYTFDF